MFNVTRYYSLTSPAGTFEFSREVPLSHAKLVRDTITASVFGANTGTPIRRNGNPMTWLRSNMEGNIKNTPFQWYPA